MDNSKLETDLNQITSRKIGYFMSILEYNNTPEADKKQLKAAVWNLLDELKVRFYQESINYDKSNHE